MATAPRPITSEQFTLAIQDLPLENLYTKAAEIHNSIAHLQRSNAQLKEFSDSIRNDGTIEGATREEVGDRECLEAIRENQEVIERQRERVGLLRAEVERRGQRWHDGEEAGQRRVNGTGGSLGDEELRRRMEEQLREDEDDGDDDGGVAQGSSGGGGLHL